MIKLLIFDLDGTLVDTRQDVANSFNHALNEYGLHSRSLEEITRAVEEGIEKLIEKCISSCSSKTNLNKKKILQLFRNHYQVHCVYNSAPYPGVMDFLEKHAHLKMAVLSNKPERYCRIIFKRLKMSSFFSAVVGGDTVSGKKPDPSGARSILKSFNLPGEQALMIGDSAPDVLAARSAGMPCVGILNGMGMKEPLLAAEPEYMIDGFSQLEELINRIGVME